MDILLLVGFGVLFFMLSLSSLQNRSSIRSKYCCKISNLDEQLTEEDNAKAKLVEQRIGSDQVEELN